MTDNNTSVKLNNDYKKIKMTRLTFWGKKVGSVTFANFPVKIYRMDMSKFLS